MKRIIKQQWLKERTKAVIYEKKGTKKINRTNQKDYTRVGWKRYTTYLNIDSMNWLFDLAVKRQVFVMDLLEDILRDYRNKYR